LTSSQEEKIVRLSGEKCSFRLALDEQNLEADVGGRDQSANVAGVAAGDANSAVSAAVANTDKKRPKIVGNHLPRVMSRLQVGSDEIADSPLCLF
jgi:hypothetical protein